MGIAGSKAGHNASNFTRWTTMIGTSSGPRCCGGSAVKPATSPPCSASIMLRQRRHGIGASAPPVRFHDGRMPARRQSSTSYSTPSKSAPWPARSQAATSPARSGGGWMAAPGARSIIQAAACQRVRVSGIAAGLPTGPQLPGARPHSQAANGASSMKAGSSRTGKPPAVPVAIRSWPVQVCQSGAGTSCRSPTASSMQAVSVPSASPLCNSFRASRKASQASSRVPVANRGRRNGSISGARSQRIG